MAAVDIGHDVQIEILHSALAGGTAVGLDYEHPRGDSRRCVGFVYFDTPQVRRVFTPDEGRMWSVKQEAPLTLWPSLLCQACGHHGWIRDGRWVPAGGEG